MSAPRSRASVVAAVLAMAASSLTLAALIFSDIAEAGTTRESLADEAPVAAPVKQKKLVVKTTDTKDVAPVPKKKKRISFGRFEGY